MPLASPKGIPSFLGFPRPLSSLLISAVTLALFLVITSKIIISYPISSTIHEYIVGIDHSTGILLFSSHGAESSQNIHEVEIRDASTNESKESGLIEKQHGDSTQWQSPQNGIYKVIHEPPISGGIQKVPGVGSPISGTGTEGMQSPISHSPESTNSSSVKGLEEFGDASRHQVSLLSPPPQVPADKSKIVDSGSCNLYQGRWIYDAAGPLYTNNSCPMITQMQNCQGNGRPDKDYENWRWKPDQCDLPRFDARKFLQLMRGKTLAFIGDSVARNQMESMLCILWQVERPRNRGNRRMQRWYFQSTHTTIVRIWSSWLVHRTSEPIQFAPEGVDKLHLDLPDETFMEFLPTFDVVVLSSGHWFAKKSVYVLNNTIVGGQLWWPDKTRKMQVNNVNALSISVETILTSIVTNPNYTGLTIVRSFSPDHYEGGAWNTGGSCTGKVRPATEVVRNTFTDAMHSQQVEGFERATGNTPNGSKLRFMDITEVFGHRHDGHPGPYRSPDPNKVTKRGPDGRPPPQDCLHWCMPGPVDTWNELVMEIIRREFEFEA